MHGISQDPDPKSVIHWRTQLCYAMKEAMNETMNEDNIIKPFLLPNNVIHQLAEIVNKRIIEELEPGNQFHVVNEPKDTRRVLKKNNNRKDKNDCKEETGFFDKIIKYFKD
jgi:hypothetical protein